MSDKNYKEYSEGFKIGALDLLRRGSNATWVSHQGY